jgi:hypothetical protein
VVEEVRNKTSSTDIQLIPNQSLIFKEGFSKNAVVWCDGGLQPPPAEYSELHPQLLEQNSQYLLFPPHVTILNVTYLADVH